MINNIVPTPKSVKAFDGKTTVELLLNCEEESFGEYAATFKECFKKLFKVNFKDGFGGVTLRKDDTLPTQAYRYDSTDGIVLSASSAEGILYAIATLLLTATVKDGKLTVSRAVIEDYPEKEFRALMVDLARAWHPAYTVYQYIDLCFILKIKYLHLHFIDNERYTLPSKAFPLLNDEESYTYDEIAKMRERAKARGVVIIPEFEVPGHAAKLTGAYPEIFANEIDRDVETAKTENGTLITDASVVCAGKSEIMSAVKTLLKETCELFPDAPYVHIGGDEANIKVWSSCPHCREYMAKHNISGIYELYSEFVGRTAKALLELGKTPIVWEGFPKEGVAHIPKETVVIAWETMYHMPHDLIKEGFKVINASWKPLYVVPNPEARFNWGITDIIDTWSVYNWQHWYEKSAAYKKPIDIEPTEQLIGAMLCLWECTFEQEINRGMNNLAALSEKTWSVESRFSGIDFIRRATPSINRIARLIQSV